MTNPFGHPVPSTSRSSPSGVTAIPAGVAAFLLSGFVGYLPVKEFIEVGIDVPQRLQIVLGMYLFAGIALLAGAIVTFFRTVTGGVLLIVGAVVTIAALLSEPLVLYPGSFAQFFRSVFSFSVDDAFVRVAATIGGPVVLVLAAMPATFRYLRYPAYASGGSSRGW